MNGKTMRENAAKTLQTAKRARERGAALIFKNAMAARVIEYIARFLAGWLLSGAVIFNACAPFAVGFVASSGGGLGGLSALFGVAAGAFINGGFNWGVKYSATALLVFAAALVFKELKAAKKLWFMPAMAALMSACTGAVYLADGGINGASAALYITEITLSAASALFYRAAFSEASGREQEKRRSISAALSVCTLLIALSDVSIMGMISIGRVAAAVCVLSAAHKGGASAGALGGVALGVGMDAASGGAGLFTAAFSSAGAVAGLFRGAARLILAVVYIVINAVAVIWGQGERLALASLYETFIASVIFLVLPEKLFLRVRDGFLPKRGEYRGEERSKAYVRKKAELAAEAFSAVYRSLGELSGDEENKQGNVMTVFDAAAERKCALCKKRENCYGEKYETTRSAQNDAVVRLVVRGELTQEDFPEYFLSECVDIPGLLKIVNEEYAALLRRRERLNRANEGYELLNGRFLDMAEVFEGFSEQLAPASGAEKDTEENINLYLASKSIDLTAAVFKDCNSRLHIELSGDGAAAFKRSQGWLEKISAAAGKPLCEYEGENERGRISLLEAEPLKARIGVASMRRDGESVSGDKGAYFKTDSGRLYVILSDGMGSGEGAAQDSGDVIDMLEKFLRAGVSALGAMRLVGAAVQMKNEKTLTCASIDLLSINLFNGETDIFKLGAAPSLVKNKAGVSVLRGESLLAGMSGEGENLPDHIKTRLTPGSAAVIVSDGVTGGEDGDWIGAELAKEETPGREFARRVLEKAGEKFGCADDMTVITVSIEAR